MAGVKGRSGRHRVSTEVREAIGRMIDEKCVMLAGWLQRVADGDPENDIKPDPAEAFKLLCLAMEFAVPKLSRTELVGDEDNPVVKRVEIAFIDGRDKTTGEG